MLSTTPTSSSSPSFSFPPQFVHATTAPRTIDKSCEAKDIYQILQGHAEPHPQTLQSATMTQQQKVVSQYPLPPIRYYRNFNAAAPTPPPPPPSSDQTYHMFGGEYTVEDHPPSLEEAGRKRLYDPSAPPCDELRRLNKQLLAQFMQLANSLCEPLPHDAPEDPHKDAITSIEDIFVNMQHLINLMRPAQAAMDLKILLDRQTTARKQMAEQLQDSVNKAWELIGEAAAKLSESSVDVSDAAKGVDSDNMQTDGDHPSRKEENGAKEEIKSDVIAEIAKIVADTSL